MHPFVFNAMVDAKTFFQAIDPRFEPGIFYFVVPLGKKKPPFAFGPDGHPFGEADFRGVMGRAEEIERNDPDRRAQWMPDPEAGWTKEHQKLQDSTDRKLRYRALHRAVGETLDEAPAGGEFAHYCGWPAEYNGDLIVPVLRLQRPVHDTYHRLKVGRYRDRMGYREFRRDRSLIDAAAWCFLSDMTDELASGTPGADWSSVGDKGHMLVRAGKGLMHTAGKDGGHHFAGSGLFDACNTLSTLRYEGKEGVGRIVFARRNHPHVETAVALASPVSLHSGGAARKLLQMASGPLSLLSDGYDVYGLGKAMPSYDLAAEDVFSVSFIRQFVWTLHHGEHAMMQVRFGVPGVVRQEFPEERFRRDVPRVFPGISSGHADRLFSLAARAAGQKHGCMLVIAENAKPEAERLNAQSTPVEPFPLTDELVPLVTAIDGSVLVDTGGVCHAIGAILDGMAAPTCSPERGARYNSAVRYTYRRAGVMAVVKSEDGMVSVFPELRPQVRRSEIRVTMEALRKAGAAMPVEKEALWKAMSWLRDHAFYLTLAECDEAERLNAGAQARLPTEQRESSSWTKLVPHPDMNDSYYQPE